MENQTIENKTAEVIEEAKRDMKLELEKLHETGASVSQVCFIDCVFDFSTLPRKSFVLN